MDLPKVSIPAMHGADKAKVQSAVPFSMTFRSIFTCCSAVFEIHLEEFYTTKTA